MSTFKKDKYKSTRGTYSRMLDLCCYNCGKVFAEYQKDGAGNLRRLYMDRITAPKNLVGLEKKNIKNVGQLKCPKCGFVIAVPYIYPKENRKAFRVFQDALMSRIKKINSQ